MADLLPNNFPPLPEAAIASYDYTDIDEGTGYVLLDGFKAVSSTANSYQLSKLSPYSGASSSDNLSLVFTATTGTTECNVDTAAFQRPKTLNGNVIVNFSAATKRTGAGNSGLYIQIQLYHVTAGGTETAMGSQWTSPTITSSGGGDVAESWFCALIEAGEKDFKIGEKLRVEVKATVTGSDADQIVVGIDPANRDITGFLTPSSDARFFTRFMVLLPFEVDL